MKQSYLNDEIITIAKKVYKIDLSGYKPSFIDRRLKLIAMRKGIFSARQFKELIINSGEFNHYLEEEIPVHVTSLFRDHDFFNSLINHISDQYNIAGTLKIWHPGCSDGSEVYSMAMLMESRMNHIRYKLLGTDISHESILSARSGSLNCTNLNEVQTLYRASGGKGSIREHVISSANSFIIRQKIYDKIRFSRHILGTDSKFTKFDVIICRNMLMYYNENAKEKITKDLYDSLHKGGILAIGKNESIHELDIIKKFEIIDKKNKIYKKID
jgi:chemotaxis protein methyltransferase CheR